MGFPIQAPDPANPGRTIWVDSDTRQPVPAPGTGPNAELVGTTTGVSTVQVPAGTNIDPNASRGSLAPGQSGPVTQTPAQQASNQAQTNAQTAPSTGGTNGTLFTPDALTKQQAAAVQQANLNVVAAWDQVNKQQALVDDINANPTKYAAQPTALQDATSTLNALYTGLTNAENAVRQTNSDYGAALDKAIIDPSQAQLQQASAAKATADGNLAAQQAKVLTDGAPGQRALAAAQAAQASSQAALAQANADAITLKAGPEADQARAQATLLTAQGAQINALIGTPDKPGPLIQKAQAEVGLTQAQTDLTGSQSALAKAQAAQADANTALLGAQSTLLVPAQANAQQASANLQNAQATGTVPAQAALAGAQAGLAGAQATQTALGPMGGLAPNVIDAIKAVQQQVFNNAPPGSDPEKLKQQANDLFQQYANAQIGGTTPYAASVAAANQAQNVYQTQAAMANQAQAANASRANALAGVGGNVFSTLAGMNANAPKGSTALVGAFQDVINNIQGRMNAQGFGAPANQPQAPALPSFLQQFAAQGAPGAPAPAPNVPMPNPGANSVAPPAQSQPTAAATTGGTGAGQGGTTAPITINIGGGSSPGAQGNTGASDPNAMPKYLNGMQAPTMDFLHQLWGKEIGGGMVQSPGLGQLAGY